MVTTSGIKQGDYDALIPGTGAPEDAAGDLSDTGWQDAVAQMLGELTEGAAELSAAGAAPPDEIGYMLQDASEDSETMAELIWNEAKLAVLVGEYMQDSHLWEAAGWNVVLAADANWWQAVASKLNAGGGVGA